jgi:hypothetical protein
MLLVFKPNLTKTSTALKTFGSLDFLPTGCVILQVVGMARNGSETGRFLVM